ncbi:MAG: lytic transglycosylase, catalytic [Herbaspirillum sp.]|nr:lytic transglycosylase, catalytic [Herbaspirillum sp.]
MDMYRSLISWILLLSMAFAISHAAAQNAQAGETDLGQFPGAPEALVKSAVNYEHGEGVSRDYLKAAELYCKAAKMGNADAQYALGWMYANGRGVGKDDGIAAQLFAMAAAQGHQQARTMMRYTQAAPGTSLPLCLLPEQAPVVDAVEDGITLYQQGPINRMVKKLVDRLAPRFQVDPGLAMAVIAVESGFNIRARSPKNAQGLMQLIPATAQRFHVRDAFDAEDNIKGGLAYLQWLLTFFKGDVQLVAAAYNAGEEAVETHRGIPPYPETQAYVQKIVKLYKKTSHPVPTNPARTPLTGTGE